jgi:hypothetical protein
MIGAAAIATRLGIHQRASAWAYLWPIVGPQSGPYQKLLTANEQN